MDQEIYEKLLTEISGSSGEVGEQADCLRKRGEEDVFIEIFKNYGRCLLFGDAVHQFYMDMLRDVIPRLGSAGTEQIMHFFLHWHVLSASRFYAAFDLFKRGYVLESASLSRTLWETALTMAALKRAVVAIEEVFGGPVASGYESSTQEIVKRIKRCDAKIQRVMIWKNPDLDAATKSAIETFLSIVNNATHKSKAGLAINIMRQQRSQPIFFFPYFDPKLAEASWNVLFLSTWCLMVTLSYLDRLLPETGTALDIRYKKLLELWEELNKTPPNAIVAGFGNVVRNVYKIPTS